MCVCGTLEWNVQQKPKICDIIPKHNTMKYIISADLWLTARIGQQPHLLKKQRQQRQQRQCLPHVATVPVAVAVAVTGAGAATGAEVGEENESTGPSSVWKITCTCHSPLPMLCHVACIAYTLKNRTASKKITFVLYILFFNKNNFMAKSFIV